MSIEFSRGRDGHGLRKTRVEINRQMPTLLFSTPGRNPWGQGSCLGGNTVLVLDKHNWNAQVDRLEQEGRGLLEVIVTAATWATELSGPVKRIIDVGSGSGVGTCELALRFPHAHVVAVDASEAMLGRVSQRSRELRLADRVSTHLAELPGGLPQLAPADIVFASMFLHHTPDADEALRELRRVLVPDGLLVVIEHGPGSTNDHVPRIDAVAALAANNYDVIGERVSSGRSLIVARAASNQDFV